MVNVGWRSRFAAGKLRRWSAERLPHLGLVIGFANGQPHLHTFHTYKLAHLIQFDLATSIGVFAYAPFLSRPLVMSQQSRIHGK
jgi:hypothetical protein